MNRMTRVACVRQGVRNALHARRAARVTRMYRRRDTVENRLYRAMLCDVAAWRAVRTARDMYRHLVEHEGPTTASRDTLRAYRAMWHAQRYAAKTSDNVNRIIDALHDNNPRDPQLESEALADLWPPIPVSIG